MTSTSSANYKSTEIHLPVWRNTNNNNLDAGCYTCNKLISAFDFEVGHVIAEANGGSTTEDNLKPICRTCNRSMGTKNIEEFKSQHFAIKPKRVVKPKDPTKSKVVRTKKSIQYDEVPTAVEIKEPSAVDKMNEEIAQIQLDNLKKEKEITERIKFIRSSICYPSFDQNATDAVIKAIASDDKLYEEYKTKQQASRRKTVYVTRELFTGKIVFA
jgi:hypothetical protein